MKTNRLQTILTFVCCLYAGFIDAQLNPGINTSNWGGISNVTWNPAIANPRYKADISVGAINSGIVSNYDGLSPLGLINNVSFLHFDYNVLKQDLWAKDAANFSYVKNQTHDGTPKNIYQFVQAEGPGSFLFSFGKDKKNTLGVSYHFNAARCITGLDESIAINSNGAYATAMGSTSTTFTITNAAWLDYGVTYSRVVLDKKEHFFKIGVTAKLLHELNAATIQGSNVSAYSDGTNLNADINWSRNDGPAFSFGGDIGMVYEYRPKKNRLRYQMDSLDDILPKFKDLHTIAVGFAIIDMGVLPGSSSSSAHISNGIVSPSTGYNLFNTDTFINKIKTSSSSNGGSTSIILPTRFNLYLDYNIGKGFGLNLSTSISPMFSQNSPQISYGSYVAFTPRFDIPWFGAYLPFNVNFNGKVGLGVGLRLGPVWVGMSDLIGLGTGVNNGVLYGGMRIPIPHHKPKDSDGDKVSDKYDLCEFKKGTWETQGCPDNDGDGIRDAIDDCPTEKGTAYFHGCPDTDGDSIIDKLDKCPTVAGLAKFNGCPDRDGDGVPDNQDACPDKAGLVALNGCPDMDGDGIADDDDRCPKVAGPKEHHGCPDTDGDGVFDDEDDDIYTPGPKANRGAPWGDIDGDGILDNEDKCKTVFGLKAYQGCPTPPKPSLIAESSVGYDTLLFESNKAEVTTYQLQKLKGYAQKMLASNQKDNTILLYGRTDDQESDSLHREELSLKRANAVKQSLIGLGIEEKRIEVFGDGAYTPIGDNKNPITRRRNRSVAISTKIVND